MITDFNLFPTLITERLLLRRLDMNDVERLFNLRSDAVGNKYLNRVKSVTIEATKDFINNIDRIITDEKGIYWAICLKTDNLLIGTACLWNFSPEDDKADLGYELGPAYQGKGLMNEAVAAVIEFGFDRMGLKLILGVAHPDNEKSLNVLKRNGFVEDVDFTYVRKEDAVGEVVYFLIRKH